MRSAYDIEKAFMWEAAHEDLNILKFRELVENFPGDKHKTTRTRLYAALQEYLLACRVEILGGIDLTPERVNEVNPSQQTMMALNAICGFYGVDRVVIHLYLNAHLINYVSRAPHLMGNLDRLVSELYVG